MMETKKARHEPGSNIVYERSYAFFGAGLAIAAAFALLPGMQQLFPSGFLQHAFTSVDLQQSFF
ncbi:hypothetical protein [Pedobacter sp. SYSU D00535]|uniref:hypothetical protein n=1 Tax=Pedobacter sp. SYSU D00535 TaxID=2810308 RepID=UPI001A96169F|nr:hypothetical protein [Pedobacter sp. SYSU D00535]